MTQEKESRRHGIPEDAKVTPATTADTRVEPKPDTALQEAIAESDIVEEDEAGMAGGASGSSSGGSGFEGHPDWPDPDQAPTPKPMGPPTPNPEPDETG